MVEEVRVRCHACLRKFMDICIVRGLLYDIGRPWVIDPEARSSIACTTRPCIRR